jgi:hypothetical protein
MKLNTVIFLCLVAGFLSVGQKTWAKAKESTHAEKVQAVSDDDIEAMVATTPAASAASAAIYDRFAIGVGYPDLRARVRIIPDLDAELKVALAQGEEAYAGRLYLNPYSLGPLDLDLGVEAGFLNFNGVDSISGSGSYAEPFIGLEYRFLKRWRAAVDLGPTWINLSSSGQDLQDMEWTLNAALYCWLF